MANPNPNRGRSILLGSSAMIYTDQMAVDIYFDDIWNTVGEVKRVAVVCVAWGMSIAVVQSAQAPVAGQPGHWNIDPGLLFDLNVQDHGLHPLQPPGDLPNVPAGQPLPATGVYFVGATPAPPPIKSAATGKHRVFNTITYGTQVQNYRRVKEINPNEGGQPGEEGH